MNVEVETYTFRIDCSRDIEIYLPIQSEVVHSWGSTLISCHLIGVLKLIH